MTVQEASQLLKENRFYLPSSISEALDIAIKSLDEWPKLSDDIDHFYPKYRNTVRDMAETETLYLVDATVNAHIKLIEGKLKP